MTEVAEGREVARKLLGYKIGVDCARRRKGYNINKKSKESSRRD